MYSLTGNFQATKEAAKFSTSKQWTACKKSTFSEVKNFAASVSFAYVPNPNVDYYITCLVT